MRITRAAKPNFRYSASVGRDIGEVDSSSGMSNPMGGRTGLPPMPVCPRRAVRNGCCRNGFAARPCRSSRSHSKFGQAGMIGGTGPRRPEELALFHRNRHIVDARLAPAHQTVAVELPLLIAIGAEPVAAIVAPFILEAHGDAIVVERPKLLDQAVIDFLRPFACEEGDDRRPALEEFGPVAPAAVFAIGEGDTR